jgi:hypothetical protein
MAYIKDRKCLSVVSSLEEEISGGNSKSKKKYCDKGDTLFVLSNSKPVFIVFGKYGAFPILESQTKEIMISTPEVLIEKIKEVDSNMSHSFPVEFVKAIVESKDSVFQSEFAEKLKSSTVRDLLKTEILNQL